MGKAASKGRCLSRALFACSVLALLAACADGPIQPAPVFQNGAGYSGGNGYGREAVAMAPPPPAPMAMPVPRETRRVTVRPGQSLSGLAHAYHVSPRAIIEANHLKPPYKVETGMRLVIPGRGSGGSSTVGSAPLPPPVAAEPLPPRTHTAESEPDVIPLDGRAPKASPPVGRPAATPSSEAAAAVAADVAHEAQQHGAAASSGAAKSPAVEFPPEERGASSGPEKTVRSGRFPWPVQGRVLAGYGTVAGGAHNDGINIAAARGAPIRAVEGGVVAYAGNELRGYGNLVLIKHPNGFISAYAHCDELLVKKGDQIRTGQVIGKVGATGGVSQPQLHFELRRGKQPIDPREFLGPAPSAGGTRSNAG